MMDPQRRRLTVGVGAAAAKARLAAGCVPDEDDESDSEIRELLHFLDGAERHYALVSSRTENTCVDAFLEKKVNIKSSIDDQDERRTFLDKHGIGWCCKKGMKPESKNQDSFSLLVVEDSFALYCVYDGHGPKGHDVSDAVRKSLVTLFLQNKPEESAHKDLEQALEEALERVFTRCQKDVKSLHDEKKLDANMSGTTCTVVYHDFCRNTLTFAHVGDSRAVLGWPEGEKSIMVACTEDHKPDLPSEKQRIEESDPPGRVVFDGFYNYRVFAVDGPYPGLNMSRAIGDIQGQEKAGLTYKPQVMTINLNEDTYARGDSNAEATPLLLLVCTDGVWEFLNNELAIEMALVKMQEDPEGEVSPVQKAMNHLAEESYRAWMQDSENEVSDDITGIMVDLRMLQQRTKQSRDAAMSES